MVAPWTERFLEMLAEGPVEKEYALAHLVGLVPPGHAWRTYERTRRGNAQKRGNPYDEDRTVAPSEEGVRSGSRQIVVASIGQLKTRGRIRETREGDKVIYHFVRDRIVLRGEAKQEAVLKGLETAKTRYGEGWASERAQRASLARSPEDRSRAARKGWLSKTPEQRAAIIEKGLKALPPEVRAANIRRGWADLAPDERTEIAKARWAKIDASERRRRALKGVETRRRRGWFREGAERTDDVVPTRPERGVQPDQHGREGGAASDHAQHLGGRPYTDER